MARNTNLEEMQSEFIHTIYDNYGIAELMMEKGRSDVFYSLGTLRLKYPGYKKSKHLPHYKITLTNLTGAIQETLYLDRYLRGPYYMSNSQTSSTTLFLFNQEDHVEFALMGGDIQEYVAFIIRNFETHREDLP